MIAAGKAGVDMSDQKSPIVFYWNVRDLNVGITTTLLNEITPYLYIMAFCHDQGRHGRYLSMGAHVSDEKLLDCLDLMETVVDGGFLHDVCTAEGKLQYMLPTVKSVYARLAERERCVPNIRSATNCRCPRPWFPASRRCIRQGDNDQ